MTNPKNQIVWNNRKILVGKKKNVFYQNWYDAGITKISDISNQDTGGITFWNGMSIKMAWLTRSKKIGNLNL